jgi:L-lactate dehydrogenase (cytochrome)
MMPRQRRARPSARDHEGPAWLAELGPSAEFRATARRRLPPFLFHYLDGGSGEERTLAANSADMATVMLAQRVLASLAEVTTTTTLFPGPDAQTLAMPLALAPVGLGGMYARRGEIRAARAAHACGVPFCQSTVSLCALEEVVAGAKVPPWFQLYMIRDRAFMADLLDRAWTAGCRTLVFTVDMPAPGVRHRDARAGMSGPAAPLRRILQAVAHPQWALDVGLLGRPHRLGNLAAVLGQSSGMNDYMGWLAANFDPSIGWADLDWIRDRWRGTLVIKGILHPDDARAARQLGADGIVVSNHGGRQLDGAPSTISVLPAIADAVGRAMTVLLDSGVRSGSDVARAVASGADAVMIGRPWVYALAAGGETALVRLLKAFEHELRVTMTLAGTADIAALRAGGLHHG